MSTQTSEWQIVWAMRWTLASLAMTAIAGAWGAMPISLRPDVPDWLRWILAIVGVGLPALAALRLRVHKRMAKLQTDDTDQADA